MKVNERTINLFLTIKTQVINVSENSAIFIHGYNARWAIAIRMEEYLDINAFEPRIG